MSPHEESRIRDIVRQEIAAVMRAKHPPQDSRQSILAFPFSFLARLFARFR